MWMFLVNQLRSDCFDNLNKVENVVNYLFVIDPCRFLLHICILIVALFRLLKDKIYSFVVFQL